MVVPRTATMETTYLVSSESDGTTVLYSTWSHGTSTAKAVTT